MTTPLDTKGNSVVLDELYAIVGMLKLIDAANGKAALLHDTELEKGQTGQFLKLTDLCYASDLAAHVAASDPHSGYVLESTTSTTPTANFLPIANGSGKLAAGWLSEVLALADLSDVTAKTGTGTTVVMSAAPSVTGVWSFNAGLANQGSLTFFDANYGIGIDSSDLTLWANNAQGIAFRQSNVGGALSGRLTADGFGVGDVFVPLDRLHALGRVRSASTATDLANKTGLFVGGHRSNSEEPLGLIGGTSTATTSIVFIGGGISTVNAATVIAFYTAGDSTTTTGTLAGYIGDNGWLYWEHPMLLGGASAGYYFQQRDNNARTWALYATSDIAYINNSSSNVFGVSYYGDVSQIRHVTMTGRLSQASIIESGYVEGNPTNFRFDQDCLRYVTRWGTATITKTGGISDYEVDQMFSGQTGFMDLYGKSDPCSIEVTGLSINNSNHTAFYPYVFLHANNNAVTVKMEVKKGAGAWEVLYDGATEGAITDYHIAKVASTGADLTGVRWTFSNILNPTYLRRIGCIAKHGEAYQDTLLKSGGTVYGPVTISNGYTLTLANLTASQAVFTDASKNLVSISTTGSGNVVRATSPTITTPVIAGGTLATQPTFTSGCEYDGADGGAGLYQTAFGYGGWTNYKHFLRTRHYGGAANNAFDFFTCGGTPGGTLADAILGLTIEAGSIKLGTASAIVAYSATNISERVSIGTNNGWPTLSLYSSAGAQGFTVFNADVWKLGSINNHDVAFITNNTERARIAANGNVGIGCAPSAITLSVGGDIVVGYRTTPDDTYACRWLMGTPYHFADGPWYGIGFNANNGSNNLLLGWNNTTSISLASDSTTTSASPRVVATVTYNGMTIDAGTFGVAGLTASQGVLTDSSKNLVSVALTGTGSLVRATSPTIATPSLVDGAANVQLSIGTDYVNVATEIRFAGVSYSRVSFDSGNGAPFLGYNCKLSGSAFKHDSTGTLAGLRFTGSGDIYLYTNASAAANTTVTPQVSINSAGVVGVTSLTASKLVATNGSKQLVSYDLVATDIPTLTSSNAIEAAKGHRFWMHVAAADLNSALTQLVLPIGGIDSITYPTPIPRACKLVRISITAMHADSTTPPSTWTVDVYKNGSSASTMSFNLNASPFSDTTTSGTTSSTITFAADDTVGIKLTGTSLDALVARISLEFETTS